MTTFDQEAKGKQNFKAIFSHYVAIKHQPHYVFTTEEALLVNCNEYPDMIGELNAYDRVELTAEIQETCKDGVILKNVEWRLADEK
jgi:hypothetical protein